MKKIHQIFGDVLRGKKNKIEGREVVLIFLSFIFLVIFGFFKLAGAEKKSESVNWRSEKVQTEKSEWMRISRGGLKPARLKIVDEGSFSSLQMKGGAEELDDEAEGSENPEPSASEPLPPSGYSPSSEGEKIDNTNENTNTNDNVTVENENINQNENTNTNDDDNNNNDNTNTNDNTKEELPESDMSIEVSIVGPKKIKAGEEFEIEAELSKETSEEWVFRWDLDNNDSRDYSSYSGKKLIYQQRKPGEFKVLLEASNDRGRIEEKEFLITVENPILNGQVKIAEALPDPVGSDSASMPDGEWVKLYNDSENWVDLAGWVLYDTENTHELFITQENILPIQEDLLIEPRKYLIVFRNEDSDFSLNNGGDKIRLCSGPIEMEGLIQSEMEYGSVREGEIAFGELKVKSEKLTPVPFGTGQEMENGKWKMENRENDNASVGADLRVRPVPSVRSENDTHPVSPMASHPSQEGINTNIFAWFSVPVVMAAEEKNCLDFDFSKADFGGEGFALGETKKSSFEVKNRCSEERKVYLGTDLGEVSKKDLALAKNFEIVVKNDKQCVLGCKEKINLFDLRERAILVEKIKGGKEEKYHFEITSKNDKTLYDDKNRDLNFRWVGASGELKVKSLKLKGEGKIENGENDNNNNISSNPSPFGYSPSSEGEKNTNNTPLSEKTNKTFIASIEGDKSDRGGWFNWVNFAFLRKFLIIWAILTVGILVVRKTIKFKNG